jgi:hypothetical protein
VTAVGKVLNVVFDMAFEIVVKILIVQYELLALLLGPYRPARHSDAEGWILALLFLADCWLPAWVLIRWEERPKK